jgi:ubiquinone/menaquinone biosynthesis C-methylase UbiE
VTTPADVDAALERALALIRPELRPESDGVETGLIDLLGSEEAPQPTAAQRAMNSNVVAAIYQRLWRPVGVRAMGLYALSDEQERRQAVSDLRLGGAQHVLDVACGPGNFTSHFGTKLSGDGIAIGFDISRPMLEMAVRENRNSHTAYVRGDARRLPFDDNTFHAVSCYAALYLVPEPFAVVDEIIRVLAPDGRVAIMTSYGRENPLVHRTASLLGAMSGLRVFDRSTFPRVFADAGLVDVQQSIRGFAQFVSARKP